MATSGRSSPAPRALALDLVLRTLMSSTDYYNVSKPRIWENISRLVPGTTPQQCAQRWEELVHCTNTPIAGDLSGLTATGKTITSHRRTQKNKPAPLMCQAGYFAEKSSSDIRTRYSQDSLQSHSFMWDDKTSTKDMRKSSELKKYTSHHGDQQTRHSMSYQGDQSRESLRHPGDHRTYLHYYQGGVRYQESQKKGNLAHHGDPLKRNYLVEPSNQIKGAFTANFYQNVMSRPKLGTATQEEPTHDAVKQEKEDNKKENENISKSYEEASPKEESIAPKGPITSPNMVIHVYDDIKKVKKDFVCSQDVLVREMCYFAGYFLSETQLWDEVDISVHCDIPVFEWLIRYAKRGMFSGPCGEKLKEPLQAPTLEADNAVSILISSEYLKMDHLVEECLQYCYNHISAVVATPCSMGCINDKTFAGLAAKFTPLEVEEITDKKDKVKSKLFLYHLEQLFKPNYSTEQSPFNAATLFLCKFCNQMLTMEQEQSIPCTAQRISFDRYGKVVYQHERIATWNINTYIQSLQRHEGLSPRDLYWKIWSLVNTLKCEECHTTFQCSDLMRCPYHPGNILFLDECPYYSCCNQIATKFSLLPHLLNGCYHKKHSVSTTNSEMVYSIVLKLRDEICKPHTNRLSELTGSNPSKSALFYLLQDEHKHIHYTIPPVQRETTQNKPSKGHVVTSSSSSLASGSVKQTIPHNKLQDNSDLEEDEEVAGTKKQAVTTSSKSKKKGTKQKHSKQSNLTEDWIWDYTKSTRWNQDMQRESDTRRLQQLKVKISQAGIDIRESTATLSSATSSTTTTISKQKEVTYAGGIFSRLEEQFRAQQAVKAMTSQPRYNTGYYVVLNLAMCVLTCMGEAVISGNKKRGPPSGGKKT